MYRPRGTDPLRRLFRRRFPAFQDAYEQRYAATFGRFRLPLITRAAAAFRLCGDWSQGIARIRCPACGFDRHEIPTSPASSSAGTTQVSVDSGTRIQDQPTREALCQYIPVDSMKICPMTRSPQMGRLHDRQAGDFSRRL